MSKLDAAGEELMVLTLDVVKDHGYEIGGKALTCAGEILRLLGLQDPLVGRAAMEYVSKAYGLAVKHSAKPEAAAS